MKVIFLDVDGVLNCLDTFKRNHDEWVKTGKRRVDLDLEKIGLLKEIIDETSSEIVLSSTWRLGFDKNLKPVTDHAKELVKLFREYNLEIYDMTPRLGTKRGIEIKKWLSDNPEVTDFVILDDDSDMEEYNETNLVQTNFYEGGLLEKHKDKIKEILHIKDKMKEK